MSPENEKERQELLVKVNRRSAQLPILTDEMREVIGGLHQQNQDAKKLLQDAANQIEYLHEKFRETGTGNQLISRIKSFLEKS